MVIILLSSLLLCCVPVTPILSQVKYPNSFGKAMKKMLADVYNKIYQFLYNVKIYLCIYERTVSQI